MSKGRLEAFSDGVIAIIITIMVLDLKVPSGDDPAALLPVLPTFVGYLLSFVFVGIYWNNHHHTFQAVRRVNGATLWANMHLLFWLSLIPFVTNWMGAHYTSPWPVAIYGAVLLMCGFAYYILTHALIRHHGPESLLAEAFGDDFKGKISLLLYAIALPLAFANTWLAYGLYVAVAAMWLVPDSRIEKRADGERAIGNP